jgi:hypothetical protein
MTIKEIKKHNKNLRAMNKGNEKKLSKIGIFTNLFGGLK